VEIQFAGRNLHFVTSLKSLNKQYVKCNIHITLTLCTSASGDQMAPHYLFQKSEEKHLLVGTSSSTCESNDSGYQEEKTFQT
jgi:hypothetical protein